MTSLKVLVACEESQRVCLAFRKLGHEAYSADLQECTGGHPVYHIKGDCIPLLNGFCRFITEDGSTHFIDSPWDIIIAHPPCTFLTSAGAVRLYKNGQLNTDRIALGFQAAEFFNLFFNTNCKHVCIENPQPIGYFGLPKHTQHIEPYYFGEPFAKRTFLWLIGLPLLHPTNVLSEYVTCMESEWFNNSTGGIARNRSKTFQGIADAIAAQYSAFVLGDYGFDYQLTMF